MVGRGHELVELVQRLGEGARALHRAQREGRYGLQGHRGEDAERAEPDAGGGEDVGVLEHETVTQVLRQPAQSRRRLVCQLRITGPITLVRRGVRPSDPVESQP